MNIVAALKFTVKFDGVNSLLKIESRYKDIVLHLVFVISHALHQIGGGCSSKIAENVLLFAL